MKKKTNKKRVPAYAFGIDDALEIGGIAGSTMEGLGGDDSGLGVAGKAIGGVAKGAQLGMSFGPIGAVAGGALGLAGGLFKGITQKKAIERAERIAENRKQVALGKNNAAALMQEYYEDNPTAYTFENGGILPDLAYVDNNEVIRDDYGNIIQIPNSKPGVDNHLIDASALDSVLSDNLKRPGTKHTFAEEGKILTKMAKPSKGKDRFAENTNRLNRINANRAFDNLLMEQEEVKSKKGIKPKVKGIPAYEDGKKSKLGEWLSRNFDDSQTGTSYSDRKKQAASNVINTVRSMYESMPSFNDWLDNFNSVDWTKGFVSKPGPAPGRAYIYDEESTGATGRIIDPNRDGPMLTESLIELPEVIVTGKKPIKSGSKTIVNSVQSLPVLDVEDYEPTISNVKFNDRYTQSLEAPSLKIDPKLPSIEDLNIDLQSKKYEPTISDSRSKYSPDWLSLAPTMYNFAQSLKNPEIENPVLNPYSGAINRAMAKRRINIEPTLAANRRASAINRANMARLNPNTGMNLAYGNQIAAGEYAQNADIYATRDNANNQYLGEYANIMNNLGQQYVQNAVYTNDINARNRARARDYAAAAATQVGKWSQVRRQEENQFNRDQMTLPFLKQFLSQGYTQEMLDSAFNQFNSGRNKYGK